MCLRMSSDTSCPVQSARFLMCALEFTSHTAGAPSVIRMSTPQKSAPTASAAFTASSAHSSDSLQGSILPPMVQLLLKSPSGPCLTTASATLPPITSARMSVAPVSMYFWAILGTYVPERRPVRESLSRTRRTCSPKDPKQSFTTIG